MKKTLIAASLTLLALSPTFASADVKVGALMGITGPLANFIPPILNAAKLVESQINAAGGILGGQKFELVVADSQGSAQPSVDAANKLVNIENVAAIVGALSSGATVSAANAVAIPNKVLMISPSATAPSLTDIVDNDYLYRLVPSDDYQGKILAKALLEEGLKNVAVTYVSNDYGEGIAKTFQAEYLRLGGKISGFTKHEDKKNSYRGELATLASKGGDALVVIAYAAGSGSKIVKQSLENGFFDRFVGTDGLRDDILIKQIGGDALKTSFFTSPTSPANNPLKDRLHKDFTAKFGKGAGKPFSDQSYDATMLAALAIEKAGSTDRTAVKNALRQVANAPGVIVGPGEWKKAVALIKAGTDINYQGASGDHEFDEKGDVSGLIGKYIVQDNAYKQTLIYK